MDLIQFRVHPGVGVARIGESTDWYFLGPEIPRFLQEQYPLLHHTTSQDGRLQYRFPSSRSHPENTAVGTKPDDGRYRDTAGKLMPQAARFRVFAYLYSPGAGDPYKVMEITSADADIEWQVELANVKAVKKVNGNLQVDPNTPGVFTLRTKDASPPIKCQKSTSLPNLAYLKLEDSNGVPNGRLHVIGNEGDAFGPPFSEFPPTSLFLRDWSDPAADGSVMATVELKPAFTVRYADYKYLAYGQKDPVALPNDRRVLALPAWVVVNMPDYVPDMGHFVSLWDLALAQASKFVVNKNAMPVDGQHHLAVAPGEVHSYGFFDYFTHIHPVLGVFSDVPYVSGQARAGSFGSFLKGVRLGGKLQSSAGGTDADTTIEVHIQEAFRLKVASLDQSFLVLLTADAKKPLVATHEFVLCTAVGDDGKLTVIRSQGGTTAQVWPIDTAYLAATRGGWLQTKLIGHVGITDTTIKVDTQSGYKMPLPTPAGAPVRDGPFRIGVAIGSTVEWMTCTANNQVDGEFARELKVTRGVNAREWIDGQENLVFATASGHKKLDARARAGELSQIGGSIQRTFFGRLRKPSTLYDRPDFTKIRGGAVSIYPREFGRRMVFDQVSTGRNFDDAVNIDPGGSVARYHDVFSGMKGSACHGRAVEVDGKPFKPNDGRSVPPPLDGEDTSKPEVWGSDDLDHAVRLDDYYWIVSPADMPLLRELALTHIQYEQFALWAKTKVDKQNAVFNPRWAPLFEVVFKGSELEAFFREDGHSSEEYLDKLLSLRPLYAPAFLDMASMGKMVGGSFLAGIEVGREAGKAGNWSLYRGGTQYFPDVRFHPQGRTALHPPGMLTKDLAVPWFVDFFDCDETFWPTSAPQIAFQEQGLSYTWLGTDQVPDETAMRSYWKKVGFIRRQADGSFIEQECRFDHRP
jgi:hypothetical protein